jgi:hypothetical protein
MPTIWINRKHCHHVVHAAITPSHGAGAVSSTPWPIPGFQQVALPRVSALSSPRHAKHAATMPPSPWVAASSSRDAALALALMSTLSLSWWLRRLEDTCQPSTCHWCASTHAPAVIFMHFAHLIMIIRKETKLSPWQSLYVKGDKSWSKLQLLVKKKYRCFCSVNLKLYHSISLWST